MPLKNGYRGGERERQELQQRWLNEHRDEYRGKWVAITGERLLAVGSSAFEVYGRARSLGVPVPLIEYIEPEDQLPQQELSMKWLREQGPKYEGNWVALSGDRLLASGPDAAEVFRKAHEAGVEVPFVEYIEVQPQLPFLGW